MRSLDVKEHSQILISLWENSLTGLMLAAEDGTIIHANPEAERLLQYTESELQSMRFQDITAYSDCAHDEKMARETAKGERLGYDMFKTYNPKFAKALHAKLRVVALYKDKDRFDKFLSQVLPIELPVDACELLEHKKPIWIVDFFNNNWQKILVAITIVSTAIGVASAVFYNQIVCDAQNKASEIQKQVREIPVR